MRDDTGAVQDANYVRQPCAGWPIRLAPVNSEPGRGVLARSMHPHSAPAAMSCSAGCNADISEPGRLIATNCVTFGQLPLVVVLDQPGNIS